VSLTSITYESDIETVERTSWAIAT